MKTLGTSLKWACLALTVLLFANDALAQNNQMFRKGNTMDLGYYLLYTDPANTRVGIGLDSAYALAPFHLKAFDGLPNMKLEQESGANAFDLMVDGDGDLNFRKNDGTLAATILGGSGNVGIGTATPVAELDVDGKTRTTYFQMTDGAVEGYILESDSFGNGTWITTLNIDDDWFVDGDDMYAIPVGNVGIGTSTPDAKLEVSGKIKTTTFQMTSGASDGYILSSDASGNASWISTDNLDDDWFVSGNNMYSIPSGNVGIGTNSPDNKLEVCGTIRAEEVKVETGWCDYVFEESYPLMPLEEVEAFIKTNKHLPEIPKGTTVENEGLNLGQMSSKFMLKIEELTLYMIEQNKTLKDQGSKIESLQRENEVLKTQLEALKK